MPEIEVETDNGLGFFLSGQREGNHNLGSPMQHEVSGLTKTPIDTILEEPDKATTTPSPRPIPWNPTSRYIVSDHHAVAVARFYSNEVGGKPFYAVVGEFEGYDVASIDGEERIEIKVESTPSRTGNACIEIENTELNKPSGIMATKATKWLHCVVWPGKILGYELDVNTLKQLVKVNGRVVSNGRNARCVLIPLAVIEQNATRCIDLTRVLLSERGR